MGCGWCGRWIAEPYCSDDGTVGLFYCAPCRYFNMLDRETGRVSRIRNGEAGESVNG